MKTSFTKYFTENDTGDFTFYCDICQKAYTATNQSRAKPGLIGKFANRLWHGAKFDAAQADAKEHFNCCVKCGKWVCDDDYSPDYGLCVECDREQLDQKQDINLSFEQNTKN